MSILKKFSALFSGAPAFPESITVDYGAPIWVPLGVKRVKETYAPSADVPNTILFSSITYSNIPFGMSGKQYVAEHRGRRYCDAHILDKIIDLLKMDNDGNVVRDPKHVWGRLHAMTGMKEGIIYFFGTVFEQEDGTERVSVLNLDSRMRVLRYQIKFHEPITFVSRPGCPNYAASIIA